MGVCASAKCLRLIGRSELLGVEEATFSGGGDDEVQGEVQRFGGSLESQPDRSSLNGI